MSSPLSEALGILQMHQGMPNVVYSIHNTLRWVIVISLQITLQFRFVAFILIEPIYEQVQFQRYLILLEQCLEPIS
jgi:hypothetical protein